jgi:hypothetical protein
VRSSADLGHPLVVREIAVDATPGVARFAHPIEFVVDPAGVPDMYGWAEAVARRCERHFGLVCDEFHGVREEIPPVIVLKVKEGHRGVAESSVGRITLSADYYREHPNDLGAVMQVTANVAQAYPDGAAPGWLATGIAAYLRYFRYEPGRLGPVDPVLVRPDSNPQATAAFLDFLTGRYGDGLLRDLNGLLREGEYTPESWQDLTGRTLDELTTEWRASARR